MGLVVAGPVAAHADPGASERASERAAAGSNAGGNGGGASKAGAQKASGGSNAGGNSENAGAGKATASAAKANGGGAAEKANANGAGQNKANAAKGNNGNNGKGQGNNGNNGNNGKAKGNNGNNGKDQGNNGKAKGNNGNNGKAKGHQGKGHNANPNKGNGGKGHTPVTICHRTGSKTNPFVVITVDDNALRAHLRHGDTVATGGKCPGGGGGTGPVKHDKKITICHATGSAKNPYNLITISVNALDAHRNHQGGRDIIPAPAGATSDADCVAKKPVVKKPVVKKKVVGKVFVKKAAHVHKPTVAAQASKKAPQTLPRTGSSALLPLLLNSVVALVGGALLLMAGRQRPSRRAARRARARNAVRTT